MRIKDRKTITKLDYKVVKNKKTKVNVQYIYILIIILALYVILKHLGLLNIFNIFPTVEKSMSYGMLFIVGLITSVHCIAMCGGINLSQSVNSVKDEGKILKSNAYYNLGRVISYTIIGGIVGAIGSAITLNGIFRGAVAIIDYGRYEPITVKKGIKVKWIINVPKEKLNGCNNEIIIPKYNIDIKLKEGENVIEFFPDEEGTISYTCWMGMIKSTITVID